MSERMSEGVSVRPSNRRAESLTGTIVICAGRRLRLVSDGPRPMVRAVKVGADDNALAGVDWPATAAGIITTAADAAHPDD